MLITALKARLICDDRPQYIIASLAGISPSLLSAYAKGHKPVSPDHINKIAAVLGCESEDLLGMETFDV